MKSESILKDIAQKYNLDLDIHGKFPLSKNRSATGEINGYPINIIQRYVTLPSGDGGTGGFPFTFIDIKLNPYLPNVLIKKRVFFLPLFADSDYINMNPTFKGYKSFSTKGLFVRTEKEDIDYYKQLIPTISDLLGNILQKSFIGGAIIIDGNILRYTKGSHFLSFKEENFEKVVLNLIKLAEKLENSTLE
jgi:hypothetical protein